jgi:hypothetical protein
MGVWIRAVASGRVVALGCVVARVLFIRLEIIVGGLLRLWPLVGLRVWGLLLVRLRGSHGFNTTFSGIPFRNTHGEARYTASGGLAKIIGTGGDAVGLGFVSPSTLCCITMRRWNRSRY